MRTFKVVEGGKTWRVTMRAAYQKSITNEKRLREVVTRSMNKQYGNGWHVGLWESCGLLGCLEFKRRIELHNGKWEEVR